MESKKHVERECLNCGKAFVLKPNQLRQIKEKWPVNCSRTCAKILQHKKNHGDKRLEKSCPICGESFTVVNWDRNKEHCSNACAAKSKFGDPTKRIEQLRSKVESILRDEKYKAFIEMTARKLSGKYGVSCDDIIQDYYAELLSGHNAFIEQTAMETVRKEYNRGVVGKRKVGNAVVSLDCLKNVPDRKSFVNSKSYFEYIYDLKKITSEEEFKIVMLFIAGVGKVEIEKMYFMPKREMWKTFKRLGL